MQGAMLSYASNNQAMNQPYPAQQPDLRVKRPHGLGPGLCAAVRAFCSGCSVAGADVAGSAKSRSALAQPFPASARRSAGRTGASCRPRTATQTLSLQARPLRSPVGPRPTRRRSRMRPGESVAILANRYGVPEKEVLRANGMKTCLCSQARPRSILIPTYNGGNAAKAARRRPTISRRTARQPQPKASRRSRTSRLSPAANSSRDKSMASADPSSKTPVGRARARKAQAAPMSSSRVTRLPRSPRRPAAASMTSRQQTTFRQVPSV
jgi:hypothetical protein